MLVSEKLSITLPVIYVHPALWSGQLNVCCIYVYTNKTSRNLNMLLTSAENMTVIQYDLQQNALICVGPVQFVGGMATAVLVMYVEKYHGNTAE